MGSYFLTKIGELLMLRLLKLVLAMGLVVFLAACASGVTRMDETSKAAPTKVQPAVKSVNVWLNDDAKKLVADNMKFDQAALRSMIERSLQAQSALKPDVDQSLDVEITGFRVRSNFSAIMFGFMAGNDNVEGIVSIKDRTGKLVKKAKVSASYALGGIAGGQDGARMSWLYEEFSKHAAAEVTAGVAVAASSTPTPSSATKPD